MMISGDAKQLYPGKGPVRSGIGAGNNAIGDNARNEVIPIRYRNGRGGIDLEQIQRDRQEARRQVVRAMLGNLGSMWRRL